MEKERDTFDDLFRSKLQDFEVDTMPGGLGGHSRSFAGKSAGTFPPDITLLGCGSRSFAVDDNKWRLFIQVREGSDSFG